MEQEVWGSIPGLAATISEIGYPLLPSRHMAEISLKWRKSLKCKIQKNWCTVTVIPTIEHHGGHSRTPANQRWDQVPGRSQNKHATTATKSIYKIFKWQMLSSNTLGYRFRQSFDYEISVVFMSSICSTFPLITSV